MEKASLWKGVFLSCSKEFTSKFFSCNIHKEPILREEYMETPNKWTISHTGDLIEDEDEE